MQADKQCRIFIDEMNAIDSSQLLIDCPESNDMSDRSLCLSYIHRVLIENLKPEVKSAITSGDRHLPGDTPVVESRSAERTKHSMKLLKQRLIERLCKKESRSHLIDYEKVELLVRVFTKHEIVGYVVTQVISNMSKKELRTSEKKESDISLLGLLEKHGMTYKRDKKRVFFGMGHVVHWNHKKKRFVVGNLCEATLSEMTFIELQKELSIIAPVPENPRSSKRLHRRNTSTVRIAPVKK